jgi:hypothetical protein
VQVSEDWRPAALTGNRKQGYVRLEAGSHDLLQIRWEYCKEAPHDLLRRTEKYLAGLQQAAKRRQQNLTFTSSEIGKHVDFKWNADAKGVGRLLFDEATKRVFILERSADKRDSVVAEAHKVFDSFQSYDGVTPWSVLGFEVRLPTEFELEKFKFLTGRLTLNFKAKGIALTAERWSLADSILKKHDILDWTRGLIGDGEIYATPYGLSLTIKPKLPAGRTIEGYVRHDEENNRLLVLKAAHRNRPLDSDWLP